MRLLLTALLVGILGTIAFAGPEVPIPGPSLPTPRVFSPADDVFATADLTNLLDPPGNSTQHFGPYPSTSPDSGTCGNNWATDTFDRHFIVTTNADGTFLVVEQFKRGSFTTSAGPSPGACQPHNPPTGMVGAGVTGSMHGYFIIPLPPGTVRISTDSSCVASVPAKRCTTADFIDTHFFPPCYPATCPVTTFFFHYSAGGQQLVEREWKNASLDRGGNHGDIRSTNGL